MASRWSLTCSSLKLHGGLESAPACPLLGWARRAGGGQRLNSLGGVRRAGGDFASFGQFAMIFLLFPETGIFGGKKRVWGRWRRN